MIETDKYSKMAASPLRLGTIGAGQIAQLLMPMMKEKGITVAGLADTTPGAAQSLADQLQSEEPKVYTDATTLLAAPEIEAVYLATPPSTHGFLIEQALAAGKHVLCEKPWTLNAAEARKLADTTGKYPGLRVGCCSSRFTFSPAFRWARDLMQKGALGHIRRVRLTSLGGQPANLAKLTGWKLEGARAGGGMAADWGVYDIEWVRSLFGDAFDPIHVTATFDYWQREGTHLESGYQAIIQCGSGLEVLLNRQPEIGPRRHLVEIRGTRGGIDMPFAPDHTDPFGRLYVLAEDGKVAASSVCPVPVNDWLESLTGPLVEFIEVVRGDATPSATPQGQIVVHEVLDAIYVAARERRSVKITQ